jgi:hypothetical protein
MDERTLDWIESHEDSLFSEGPAIASGDESFNAASVLMTIDQFAARREWYSIPSLADSIHGLRHTLRVIALSHVVVRTLATGSVEPDVYVAASLHDLRRENDRQDPDHGTKAALWWLGNMSTICETYGVHNVDKERVSSAIRFHEIPGENLSSRDIPIYNMYNCDIDTLKLADALDRYRLPKAKWWIDDSKVRIKPSPSLRHFAFRLMARSERHFLRGISAQEAVRSAVMEVLQ